MTTIELSRAISELEDAERALEVAMSALQIVPRSQKTAISAALEQALDRLRAARAELHTLEAAPPANA